MYSAPVNVCLSVTVDVKHACLCDCFCLNRVRKLQLLKVNHRWTRNYKSVSLGHQHHSRYVQLIFPFDMPHLVSGINSLLLSVTLVSVSLLAFSCSSHFFCLSQLTTLTIHNSSLFSLPPQNLPLSQTFPTIDSLPASGLTP